MNIEFKLNKSFALGLVTSYIICKVTEFSSTLAGVISQNPQFLSYYVRTSIEVTTILLIILIVSLINKKP